MTTELQEQFKNYVFEDVKANLDKWGSMDYYGYWGKEDKHKFRAKIIGLRWRYANENGLKTVTSLCPKPSNLADKAMEFRCDYIKRESARLIEEYKPLAIAKVINDEELIEKLKSELTKSFSEYVFYKRDTDILYSAHWELREALEYHYYEIKHTLRNPSNVAPLDLGDLANELLISLFTVSLTLKDGYLSAYGNVEQVKEVA